MTGGVRKWLAGIGSFLMLVFIGLQFTNPPTVNPPMLPGHDAFASNAPPASVAAMLKNSCYDCHSFESKWPWYSHVAPVSWFVVGHVNEARGILNFSDWPQDDPKRARKKWNHVADEVEDGAMPLASYTLIHRDARLDAQQRSELVKWARQQAER